GDLRVFTQPPIEIDEVFAIKFAFAFADDKAACEIASISNRQGRHPENPENLPASSMPRRSGIPNVGQVSANGMVSEKQKLGALPRTPGRVRNRHARAGATE